MTRRLPWGPTLVHSVLSSGGDLEVTDAELIAAFDPLNSLHTTQALQALCNGLDATATRFPGSKLQMRFAVKPEPPDAAGSRAVPATSPMNWRRLLITSTITIAQLHHIV